METTNALIMELKQMLRTTEGVAALMACLEGPSLLDIAEWVARAKSAMGEGEEGVIFKKKDPHLPVTGVQVVVVAPPCPYCGNEGQQCGVILNPSEIALTGADVRGVKVKCHK